MTSGTGCTKDCQVSQPAFVTQTPLPNVTQKTARSGVPVCLCHDDTSQMGHKRLSGVPACLCHVDTSSNVTQKTARCPSLPVSHWHLFQMWHKRPPGVPACLSCWHLFQMWHQRLSGVLVCLFHADTSFKCDTKDCQVSQPAYVVLTPLSNMVQDRQMS